MHKRCFSTALRYHERGSPLKVLRLEELASSSCGPTCVRLKTLLAPINPADINMIEGTYSLLPELPAIGGNEGVFEVVEVGTNVASFQVGDRVIPTDSGLGTWRSEAVFDGSQVSRVPSSLSIEQAATISVNPSTAYRMLHDFQSLSTGDVIVQNCANSAVGEAAIQIAKAKGWKTINVVRNRPDVDNLKRRLHQLGADYIITEEELADRSILQSLPKAKLALNGTCGKIASEMVRVMDDRSTMVTYGGMSKRPLMVGAASFIFKDITFKGFWQTRWNKDNGPDKRQEMFEELADIYSSCDFRISVEKIPLSLGARGVELALQGFRNGKVMFSF